MYSVHSYIKCHLGAMEPVISAVAMNHRKCKQVYDKVAALQVESGTRNAWNDLKLLVLKY